MRLLKKYGNRRLYDTGASRYVNLAEVAAIVRSGQDVRVEDVRDGADLTCVTLLQVLLEDADAADALPCTMLHRVIREGATPEGRTELRSRLADATGNDVAPGFAWDDAWRAWTGETPADPDALAGVGDAAALGALRARLTSLEERLR